MLKVFGRDGGFPFGATHRAMINAGFILVAGELAVFAERNDVEPVAVSVEVIFGEIFIPFNLISGAELFSFGPGFGFDADELNVACVGVFLEEIVAELMKQLKAGAACDIGNGGRG